MNTFMRAVAGLMVAGTLAITGPASAYPIEADLDSMPAEHDGNDAQAQRRHIEERARGQIGAPYSYGGSSPSGFDCSGFTMWVFKDHGANLPHSSGTQFELAGDNGYKRVWSRADLNVGDLVFHDTGSGRVGHAGIYVGNGRFISSTSSEGVQVRSLYDSYWGPNWVGATRVPTLMDQG